MYHFKALVYNENNNATNQAQRQQQGQPGINVTNIPE